VSMVLSNQTSIQVGWMFQKATIGLFDNSSSTFWIKIATKLLIQFAKQLLSTWLFNLKKSYVVEEIRRPIFKWISYKSFGILIH
jgi:hypothetical protein